MTREIQDGLAQHSSTTQAEDSLPDPFPVSSPAHAYVHLAREHLTHPWLTDVPAGGMPRYSQQLGWIEVLLRELDRGPVRDAMNTALLLDGLARTFGLLARTGRTAPTPPAWLAEAAAARFPRLSLELNRDWANIDDEFTEALNTVLRGAESSPHGPATNAEQRPR